MKVKLCNECHRGTFGVHGKHGKTKDKTLKKIFQIDFEEEHGHEKFMEIIGRNYL